MRILILGGTAFLSAAIARQAAQRGHQVSCLARGTNRRPPEGSSWVRADRDTGPTAYEAVADTDWDAVIDVAMQPIHVSEALAALAERAAHWTFVSTCSVYADNGTPRQDETADLLPACTGDRFTADEDYGPAKVACERRCAERIGDRLHISRPGLIGGPGDDTDRFGWWVARFAREATDGRPAADDVLVPTPADTPMQVIDVDDHAGWLLDAAERGVIGTLNALGASHPLGEFIDVAQRVAGHRGRQIAVDHDFLVEHAVGYWAGPESLGLWLPRDYTGFGCRSIDAATDAGMQQRSLQALTERTLDDERGLGLRRDRHTGLSPGKEAELLRVWSGRTSTRQ